MSRRDILGATFLRPDPVIAAKSVAEMRAGREHVRSLCDEWRAEVGMPPRAVESARELAVRINAFTADFRSQMAEVRRRIAASSPRPRPSWDQMLGERAASPVFTRSTCPDEFGNWEDEPAPIHDALVREMGAPA